MTNEIWAGAVTVLTAIIGVAILAVLVSNNAKTSQVLSAAGQSFGGILGVAVSPVTQSNSGFGSTYSGLQY